MKNKKSHYSNIQKAERGFTLIEVLIVIVVFSVGLLALSAMQFSATKGNAGAYKLTEATHITSSQLEKLFSADYSNSLLSEGSHTYTTKSYTISYTIKKPKNTTNIKKISKIKIQYTDAVSRTNTYDDVIVTNMQ